MKYLFLFLIPTIHAATPKLVARKTLLSNGNFKLESPIMNVNGKVLSIGYRDGFHGACKNMGGKYALAVEQKRVTREPMVNVDDKGNFVGISDRNYVTKSITCQI